MSDLRNIPSVDLLTKQPEFARLAGEYGRPLTIETIRTVLDQTRDHSRSGKEGTIPDQAAIFRVVEAGLSDALRPRVKAVINATGVILHTNLGRAPLSRSACQAYEQVALNYHTLEFDLDSGKRGSRSVYIESLLTRLTGVEAALVVNNNAAALLLCLSALAKRKRVVIARSQLVEIGGGFRIPDVMSQSGAKLVEVGTTNRVHISDFEEALETSAALVLRVHHSNFKITGFTTEPELVDMARIAHSKGVLLLDDLGSGALLDTARYGLAHEPTIQESLSAGADIVCISGDKLLGGPQAGIILGKADLLEKIRKHPLARAVRADKACLAALAATLVHYLKDEAEKEIPVWRMIAMPLDRIHARAVSWRAQLGFGDVIEGRSTVGGGSLPEETLPTWLLAVGNTSATRLMKMLRQGNPPVIARVENERVVFDPRTVFEDQDKEFLSVLTNIHIKS